MLQALADAYGMSVEDVQNALSNKTTANPNSFANLGQTAIDRVNESYQGLDKLLGSNQNAAQQLGNQLNGWTGELGGYAQTNYDNLGGYMQNFRDFTDQNIQNLGGLVKDVDTAVGSVNKKIGGYEGKYTASVGNANSEIDNAQGRNDTLTADFQKSIDGENGYNNQQTNLANASAKKLNNLNTSNTRAANSANKTLGSLAEDNTDSVNQANEGYSGLQQQNNTALANVTTPLNEYRTQSRTATDNFGTSVNNRIKDNDYYADDIYDYSKTAAQNIRNNATTNSGDFSEYIASNKQGLADSKNDLDDLKQGNISQNYLNAMKDAIASSMKGTIGETLNNLGQRGVLNSSVTTQAMNDIDKNASDQLAKNFLQNIETIRGLSNDKFDNTITTNHENAEMSRTKNDIANDAEDRAWNIRQGGYQDVAQNSAQNAALEKSKFDAEQTDINTGSQLAQQNFQNSNTNSQMNQQLLGDKFNTSQQGIRTAQGLAQNQFGNTTTANQLNSANIHNAYGMQNDALNSNWGRTQAGYNAGYQNNTQQMNNAQTKLGNTTNAINSEVGLQQTLLGNALQGVNTNANLYGQQYSNYGNTTNNLANMSGQQWNTALGAYRQYGDWAKDIYNGQTGANAANAGIFQNAISQAGMPIQLAGAAQEGAMQLPLTLLNASNGMYSPSLGAMQSLKGTGTTTQSQSGGNFWTGFGGQALGIGANILLGGGGI